MSFIPEAASNDIPFSTSISRDCAVVIPCLNEAASIRGLVRGVRAHLDAVIVVDDGSSDGTGKAAAGEGVQVIRHCEPQGKGAALATGFAEASRRGYSWALAMDGDGQHSPDDIPLILDGARSNRMTVGNRMDAPDGMPWARRVVNRWMSARLSRFCGVTLSDSQCGFRLVHLESWRRLKFTATHFEVESELLVRFLWAGFPVGFVPIQSRYSSEKSKIHPLRDAWRWLRWWKAIRRELAVHPRAGSRGNSSENYGRIVRNATA
jgi:glycosyltransferase involved in cell wall biosynthesis